MGRQPQAPTRLTLDVVRAVRAEVGEDAVVFVRFSATDAAAGGLDPEEVSQVAGWALEAGADLNDISAAGLVEHQEITAFPGYQVPYAAQVRRATGGPVAAVGIITSGEQAEQILADGDADAIFAGRAWLRNPHFGLQAADELGVPADIWPPQYVRARQAAERVAQ